MDSTLTQQLLFYTNELLMNDYNDPNIGLDHNPTTPEVACVKHDAGNGNMAREIDVLTGYAAAFTYFQE